MEGLGLTFESTDLALIVACFATARTSAPAPTTQSEPTLDFVFVFATPEAAQLSEFEDSERFTLRLNEGAAVEHTPPFGLCVLPEPNRRCADRRRTDSPSQRCEKPWHDKPVRRPPKDGRPTPTQRTCDSTR